MFVCASTAMCVFAIWVRHFIRPPITFHNLTGRMCYADAQHCVTDCSILGVAGIHKGLDITTLAKGISSLGAPSKFGAVRLFIFISQSLISDGFMVRRIYTAVTFI